MNIGSILNDDGYCEFIVWAPLVDNISVHITEPEDSTHELIKTDKGYWRKKIKSKAGAKYLFKINDSVEFPDPASNFQPDGVHGASQVVNHNDFNWSDNDWNGVELKDTIIYEIHVGTFTKEGTFNSAINKLDHLVELGITAVEVMPVAQFPGERNWGYDGAYPFAPQNSYGGVDGFKSFIDACHKKGLAVILDVVYNHLGPEGNYISNYAPYFTDEYRTPWGMALNYDEEYSDEVRNYFISNALYWLDKFHIDGLRLDAIDKIYDMSAKHFLKELSENVEKLSSETGKKYFLIAESDLNDSKIIDPLEIGGYGLHGQWADDFHHSIHSALTKENEGYYHDFGTLDHLIKAMNENFYYDGIYSSFRKRRHGNSAIERTPDQFTICIQNHDQIGNRAFGERLTKLISFESLKLAAGTMLLLPYVPLLFMGEEYAEENPFLYFVDHGDKQLLQAVSEGRKSEFQSFNWKGEIPDPASPETFEKSKLNWYLLNKDHHKEMFNFYRELIKLRKILPALTDRTRKNMDVIKMENELIFLKRSNGSDEALAFFNYGDEMIQHEFTSGNKNLRLILNSAHNRNNVGGEDNSVPIKNKEKIKLKIKPQSFILLATEKK